MGLDGIGEVGDRVSERQTAKVYETSLALGFLAGVEPGIGLGKQGLKLVLIRRLRG